MGFVVGWWARAPGVRCAQSCGRRGRRRSRMDHARAGQRAYDPGCDDAARTGGCAHVLAARRRAWRRCQAPCTSALDRRRVVVCRYGPSSACRFRETRSRRRTRRNLACGGGCGYRDLVSPAACLRCSAPFEGVRRTARYCSRQCADAARSRRYRARRAVVPLFAETIACETCSAPFLAVVGRGERKRFCSEDCRALARKIAETNDA